MAKVKSRRRLNDKPCIKAGCTCFLNHRLHSMDAHASAVQGNELPQQGAAGAATTNNEAAFAEAHARLIADGSIQFQFARYKPPEVPEWLRALLKLLETAAPVLKIMFWVGVAALALNLLYLISLRLAGAEWPWARTNTAEEPPEEWRMAEAPARALLSEADRLAASGRYSEAAHLLLFRSIEDIESRRPQLIRPALTSRDIAGAQALPSAPKRAFSTIVMLVERSLFGGRDLGEQDWRECRSAYETFAFAEGWR